MTELDFYSMSLNDLQNRLNDLDKKISIVYNTNMNTHVLETMQHFREQMIEIIREKQMEQSKTKDKIFSGSLTSDDCDEQNNNTK